MARIIVKEKNKKKDNKSLIVVAGVKFSKKATDRNKIKRQIRSIFKELTNNNNKQYTIIVTPAARNMSFSELKEEIKKQIN